MCDVVFFFNVSATPWFSPYGHPLSLRVALPIVLVRTFFPVACTWILAGAEFLGLALVVVYVGAVMVLFLFVVMMLDIDVERMRKGYVRYLPVGLLVADRKRTRLNSSH